MSLLDESNGYEKKNNFEIFNNDVLEKFHELRRIEIHPSSAGDDHWTTRTYAPC